MLRPTLQRSCCKVGKKIQLKRRPTVLPRRLGAKLAWIIAALGRASLFLFYIEYDGVEGLGFAAALIWRALFARNRATRIVLNSRQFNRVPHMTTFVRGIAFDASAIDYFIPTNTAAV